MCVTADAVLSLPESQCPHPCFPAPPLRQAAPRLCPRLLDVVRAPPTQRSGSLHARLPSSLCRAGGTVHAPRWPRLAPPAPRAPGCVLLRTLASRRPDRGFCLSARRCGTGSWPCSLLRPRQRTPDSCVPHSSASPRSASAARGDASRPSALPRAPSSRSTCRLSRADAHASPCPPHAPGLVQGGGARGIHGPRRDSVRGGQGCLRERLSEGGSADAHVRTAESLDNLTLSSLLCL